MLLACAHRAVRLPCMHACKARVTPHSSLTIPALPRLQMRYARSARKRPSTTTRSRWRPCSTR